MMVNRLILTLWLLWLGFSVSLAAQPAGIDRKVFEETKARADKGDAAAQLSLGFLYSTGTGVTPDAAKAAKWHRKAAEQGLAGAQYQLGLDYAEGDGVKPDKIEAFKWFRKAAEQGLAAAQLDLGLCYANAQGVKRNDTEAVVWFRKAAEQGLVAAEYELGNAYLEGTGVTKDIAEGVRWIQRAAEEGLARAQNTLGLCYQRGHGVAKDLVQAHKWFNLAAAHDQEHAIDIKVSIATVETSLTKDQIAEAQRLALEFRPAPEAGPSVPASSDNTANLQPAPSAAGQTNSRDAVTANTGLVNVKGDDDTCEIFVDGAFVGNSPARLRLAEGVHVVEVKKSGFKDYRRELKVSAGSDLTLRPVFQ